MWNHVSRDPRAHALRPDLTGDAAGRRAARREIAPLLAGYWSFGQYWGVWVILVFDFLRAHGLTNSSIGVQYTFLSIFSILTMVVVAPRLQPSPPRVTVPLSLAVLGVGAFVISYAPDALIISGFIVVGVGNGLIDIFLNVAAQRVEARTRKPILQWMHAAYAAGGVTGALAAGLLRVAHVDYRIGIAATGAR